MIAPDFVENQFRIQGRGPEAIAHVKAAILDLRSWLPDLTFTIEDTACVNGTAWVRATPSPNEGSVMGAEQTHHPVTVNVIDTARIVHGRIVEHWGVPDRFALLAQVGVLDVQFFNSGGATVWLTEGEGLDWRFWSPMASELMAQLDSHGYRRGTPGRIGSP